jgi:hypothetical protein
LPVSVWWAGVFQWLTGALRWVIDLSIDRDANFSHVCKKSGMTPTERQAMLWRGLELSAMNLDSIPASQSSTTSHTRDLDAVIDGAHDARRRAHSADAPGSCTSSVGLGLSGT